MHDVVDGMLLTRELLRRADVTAAILVRLRARYPELAPAYTLPPQVHLWPASAVDKIKELLAAEREQKLGRWVS